MPLLLESVEGMCRRTELLPVLGQQLLIVLLGERRRQRMSRRKRIHMLRLVLQEVVAGCVHVLRRVQKHIVLEELRMPKCW